MEIKSGIWNGERHRENGPAVEYSSGTEIWYQNGECHRVDGPAIIHYNGVKGWYLDGRKYSKEEHALLAWDRLTQEQRDDIIFGQPDVY